MTLSAVDRQVSTEVRPPSLNLTGSRQLVSWLKDEGIGLAFTTYQTQRLFLLGTNEHQRLSGFERLFDRAMGLYVPSGDRLWLSSKYQIWQFENALSAGQHYNGYDKLFVPRVGYTTGDLDVHDIVIDRTGRPIFVCTLLNCLATVSDRHSCTPLWKPPFISRVTNEDRCHLNGLALEDGEVSYVSAVSQSDIVDGWRDKRRDGGCIVHVPSNEIVATGLSMPHSPRVYRGKLWVLNSGTGEFGYIDRQVGTFEPVAFCPGYLRGLTFWQDYAIVGLSDSRQSDRSFSGLELDERLAQKDTQARCGLMVIDLNTGAIAHWMRLEGIISELYDVQVIPNTQKPMALGFKTDEISRLLSLNSMAEL